MNFCELLFDGVVIYLAFFPSSTQLLLCEFRDCEIKGLPRISGIRGTAMCLN